MMTFPKAVETSVITIDKLKSSSKQSVAPIENKVSHPIDKEKV